MKATAQQKAIDKYQSIEAFARRRYTKNGVLIVDVAGVPSIYSRIESAAWKKYRSSSEFMGRVTNSTIIEGMPS